jgi:SAM-dependent methyltransferase
VSTVVTLVDHDAGIESSNRGSDKSAMSEIPEIPHTDERLRRNNEYYERAAVQVSERTESRDYERAVHSFTSLLPSGGLVLDVGCGSGEHLSVFDALGYRVIGVDPCVAMVQRAGSSGLDAREGSVETLPSLGLPAADGVWAAAVLLHVPLRDLPFAVRNIRAALVAPGCPFFATVRVGDGWKWDSWDDEAGDAQRLIQLYDVASFLRVIGDNGFRVVEHWVEQSTWGRPSEWVSTIAVAGS